MSQTAKELAEYLSYREMDVGNYEYDDPYSDHRYFRFDLKQLTLVIQEFFNKQNNL